MTADDYVDEVALAHRIESTIRAGVILWRADDGAWFLLVRDRKAPARIGTPGKNGWIQLATRELLDAWQTAFELSMLEAEIAHVPIDDEVSILDEIRKLDDAVRRA